MKHFKIIYTALFVILFTASCDKKKPITPPEVEPEVEEVDLDSKSAVKFNIDKESLVRNPGMGWTIYDDAIWTPANADSYWQQQGQYAEKYASTLYIRWRWSDMEPEEGKYAWIHNDNFKALIKGARDRNLKLAFRVYIDGQDNQHQATPDFVRLAGAQGYNTTDGRGHWNPYIDDEVFQTKYSNFVKAFAKEFDDPEVVDYVDVYNIGHWGEGHNMWYLNWDANKDKSDRWLISLYADNFKRVIPVFLSNILSHINPAILKEVFETHHMSARRDGVGSSYLEDREVDLLRSIHPKSMVVGEQAYYGGNDLGGDWKPFRNDKLYNSTSIWKDSYRLSLEHAFKVRANYLDLRNNLETKGWVETAPDLVKQFIAKGGYRFTPTSLEVNKNIKPGEQFTIKHEWTNSGVGICPNKNKRWDNKFKVAFALLDKDNTISKMFIDNEANPGDWLGESNFKYTFTTDDTKELKSGKYQLVLAIINSQNENKPGIKLAIEDHELINGWTKVTEVTVL